MCTILRVKRKITEDPVDCLIIECKRNKLLNGSKTNVAIDADDDQKENQIESVNANIIKELDGDDKTSVNKLKIKEVFKYVGSAQTEDDISTKIIELKSQFDKSNSASSVPIKPQSLASKYLDAKPTKSTKTPLHPKKELKPINNYVLVNKKRVHDEETKLETPLVERDEKDELQEATSKKLKSFDDFNIIDIISSEYFSEASKKEKEPVKPNQIEQSSTAVAATASQPSKITCNGVEMIREKVDRKSHGEQFVYDIYFTKSKDLLPLDLLYSNNYEIKSSNYYDNIELVDERNLGEEEEYVNEDDEDSNEEGNWRNDYPDEDEYGDEDIDDENDEDGRLYYPSRKANHNDEDYDDDYDEYGNDYSEDEDEKKLSRYMKKSLNIGDRSYYDDESENEDFDEYKNDDEVPNSYKAYKKNLLKEKY